MLFLVSLDFTYWAFKLAISWTKLFKVEFNFLIIFFWKKRRKIVFYCYAYLEYQLKYDFLSYFFKKNQKANIKQLNVLYNFNNIYFKTIIINI